MQYDLEMYLASLHEGQWFSFSDPKNKTYDNLVLLNNEYSFPTEAECNLAIADLNTKKTNLSRINELKKLLADTDYIALLDYDKQKPDVKHQRQMWREEIRLLQGK